MTTYNVLARRWKRGWELHIDGIGVTQSHSLAEAESMARDYIALDLEIDPHSFDVIVTPEVGEGLTEAASQARRSLREAEEAQRRAAARSREVVRQLKAAGLTGSDVATLLHISPQRVSQLAKAK